MLQREFKNSEPVAVKLGALTQVSESDVIVKIDYWCQMPEFILQIFVVSCKWNLLAGGGRRVLHDGVPYDLMQCWGLGVAKIVDFNACLLRQYAFNQKTNGELWYSKTICKFHLHRCLIFVVDWHHVTFKLRFCEESTDSSILLGLIFVFIGRIRCWRYCTLMGLL